MELATGPLPWRAPSETAPFERRTDPWGEFLQRVLLSAGPAPDAASPEDALPRPLASASGRRAEVPAGQP